MSDQDVELASVKLVMRKTGDLVLPDGTNDILVAHYDRAKSHLEFETKEYAVKYYGQSVSKIGTKNKGTEQSGLLIKTFGVKGEIATAVAKDAPPRPRMGKLGDCTPELVDWLYEYDLPQFIIRYGVYTDEKGNPVRRPARRLIKTVVDRRNEDDDELQWVKDGKNTQTKAPVAIEGEWVEERKAIVARRATHLTFTPKEVIGGFDTGEEESQEQMQGGVE